jgi:hypothetical protein
MNSAISMIGTATSNRKSGISDSFGLFVSFIRRRGGKPVDPALRVR